MTSRVRRVLELVDELDLDASELGELRAGLSAREECVVDLHGADEEERAFLLDLKRRVDSILRGAAKTLSVAEANKIVREELRQRRERAASGERPTRSGRRPG